MGSTVAEDGGTSREVNVRIQKARGSFSKLRKVWLSKSLRKDTKIRIGARGGLVVKALSYKPAGRGFDSRWCHWNFSVT